MTRVQFEVTVKALRAPRPPLPHPEHVNQQTHIGQRPVGARNYLLLYRSSENERTDRRQSTPTLRRRQ